MDTFGELCAKLRKLPKTNKRKREDVQSVDGLREGFVDAEQIFRQTTDTAFQMCVSN